MARKRITPGKIRLAEVAKLAGVSPITASRFFRNPDALSAGKRARVESAAKELGYVPNLAARALASQRTEVIGVLIPSLTNNVFADVLRGIYDALDGSRYSIQLANTRYSILQEERLLRLFLAQKPAGLIITGINQTADSHRVMEAVDCPIVQIMEVGPSPIDMMIGFSHFDAAKAAIAHLLAQGYRRIKLKIMPGHDLAVLDAVRAAFPDAHLTVDANASYRLADAAHLARLDRYALDYIEQPLAFDDMVDHAALQARMATPICSSGCARSRRTASWAAMSGRPSATSTAACS